MAVVNEDKKRFYDKYYPIVKKMVDGTGLFPETVIAQMGLESGWGKSELTTKHNNFFGVKSFDGKNEVVYNSKEEKGGKKFDKRSAFKVYKSVEDSIEHYIETLKKDVYKPIYKAKTPEEQAELIGASPYASSSKYGEIIKGQINRDKNLVSKVEEVMKENVKAENTTSHPQSKSGGRGNRNAVVSTPNSGSSVNTPTDEEIKASLDRVGKMNSYYQKVEELKQLEVELDTSYLKRDVNKSDAENAKMFEEPIRKKIAEVSKEIKSKTQELLASGDKEIIGKINDLANEEPIVKQIIGTPITAPKANTTNTAPKNIHKKYPVNNMETKGNSSSTDVGKIELIKTIKEKISEQEDIIELANLDIKSKGVWYKPRILEENAKENNQKIRTAGAIIVDLKKEFVKNVQELKKEEYKEKGMFLEKEIEDNLKTNTPESRKKAIELKKLLNTHEEVVNDFNENIIDFDVSEEGNTKYYDNSGAGFGGFGSKINEGRKTNIDPKKLDNLYNAFANDTEIQKDINIEKSTDKTTDGTTTDGGTGTGTTSTTTTTKGQSDVDAVNDADFDENDEPVIKESNKTIKSTPEQEVFKPEIYQEQFTQAPGYDWAGTLGDIGRGVMGLQTMNDEVPEYQRGALFSEAMSDARRMKNQGFSDEEIGLYKNLAERGYAYDIKNIKRMSGGSAGVALGNLGRAQSQLYGSYGEITAKDAELRRRNQQNFQGMALKDEVINRQIFEDDLTNVLRGIESGAMLFGEALENQQERSDYYRQHGRGSLMEQYNNALINQQKSSMVNDRNRANKYIFDANQQAKNAFELDETANKTQKQIDDDKSMTGKDTPVVNTDEYVNLINKTNLEEKGLFSTFKSTARPMTPE